MSHNRIVRVHASFRNIFLHLITITPLYCDNQATLKLATIDNYHARTKHIDTHFHFIGQTVADGIINLLYCLTEDMLADMLMKALPKWKVAVHANTLGLCNACGGVLNTD